MTSADTLALEAVVGLLVVTLTCYLAVAVMLAGMVGRFARIDSAGIVEDDEPDVPRAAQCHAWAAARGFALRGTFRPLGVTTCVWVHDSEPTYFCLYSMRGKTYDDFVTLLGKDNAVTTGSSNGSLLFPLPAGEWKQAFPGRDLDELWGLHQEAVSFVRGRAGVGFAQDVKDFPESMAYGIRREMDYVRSLPLWPLRWPYWYFVRRRRLLNKTVREQVESGLVS